jgi:hypothetical protein
LRENRLKIEPFREKNWKLNPLRIKLPQSSYFLLKEEITSLKTDVI